MQQVSARAHRLASPPRLYHGSRGGLVLPIRPISRPNTDFGAGFYMGIDPLQTKALAVRDAQPVHYALDVDVDLLADKTAVVLDGVEWMYTVLYNRGRAHNFINSPLGRPVSKLLEGADYVIGPIADDRMNVAVAAFESNNLTDEGLRACLASVDYGHQVVCKTDEALKALTIISEQMILEDEADDLLAWSDALRKKCRGVVQEMQVAYKGKGRYLSELSSDTSEYDRLVELVDALHNSHDGVIGFGDFIRECDDTAASFEWDSVKAGTDEYNQIVNDTESICR